MSTHPGNIKRVTHKSVWASIRSAIIHVSVFSIISVSVHIATNALSASIGVVGASLVPPVGVGLFMI